MGDDGSDSGSVQGSPGEVVTFVAQGPFAWLRGESIPCVFDVPVGTAAGVYIWSINFNGSELVYYVGETGRSFSARFREHLFACLGGQYHIYDQEAFEAGCLKPLWDGMWRPGREVRAAEFPARRSELTGAVYLNLRSLRLWLIAMDTDRRQRRLVEAAIATDLRRQPPPIGSFQEVDIRYEHRDEDEPSMAFRIESPGQSLGLPALLRT